MKKHSPDVIAQLWKDALSKAGPGKEQFDNLLGSLVSEAGMSDSGEILDNWRIELCDFDPLLLPRWISEAEIAAKVSKLTLLMLEGTENNELAVLCDDIAM